MTCRFGLCFLLLSFASIAIAQVAAPPTEVPEETMQKLLVHRVNPVWNLGPDARIHGTVVLKAIVDKSGDIANLQMVSGHPMLVPSAIEAVKQWKYRPYLLNGIAVEVETTIRVEFADRNPSEAEGSGAAQSSEKPEPIANNLLEGHILRKVPPVYPPLARQARIQGTVVLRVIINKLGDVRNLQLISGHPMLAPAAIEAVKQWKYAPYELNGETVEVETDVQVNFTLAGDPPKGTVGDQSGIIASGVVGGVIGSLAKPLEGERVSEAIMRLRRIQKVDPLYPWNALQLQIQGMVVLDERVDASGSVTEVVRISGPSVLGTAAMEAVKQWKYMPYVKDGTNIAVVCTVGLSFSMTENGSEGTISEPAPVENGAPPQVQLPRRIRVSSGVSSGLLVSKVAPEYPPDARDARIQGTVVLHATIDKEGNVSTVELISGHPMLAPAAIEAVRQWRYRPYLLNGNAVEVDTQMQVNFVLAP